MASPLEIPQALAEIRAGRMVIVVDDEDRENEGDLTMAADLVTAEAVNFMATQGRGLICLALSEDRVDDLRLPMMTTDNRSPRGTAFTVSVDAREGVTTGISAPERAHTIRVATNPRTKPEDLIMPGHVFPLRARRGGVLVRSGHTEAAMDLARLAGRAEAGVICEIMRDDGEMARLPDLEAFAARHNLGVVRIADLIQYRLREERLVRLAGSSTITPAGSPGGARYKAWLYETPVEDTKYLALILGEPGPDHPVLVRVQSASLLRDVFGAGGGRSPTAWLRMIEDAGVGIFLYVIPSDASRMIEGLSPVAGARPGTAEAPLRDFGLGAQVLSELGVRKIRLLTDNPRKIAALEGYGIQVVESVPSRAPAPVLPLREGGH